jgi:hypothetical protein
MIRHFAIIVISLIPCGTLVGQVFHYPILPSVGKSISDFKPQKWSITDTAFGDLNKDGLKDVALVIEYQDTVMEVLPPDTIAKLSNPRILVIAFKLPGGGYSLVAQNNLFLLRSKEMGPGDSKDAGLFVDKKGILHIHYEFFHGDAEYKFRYQKEDFYLIGYVQHGVAGGEFMTDDYNFLTKKHRSESSWLEDFHPATSTVERITAPPLQSFKTFVHPGTWPVEEDGMVLENRY